MELSVFHWVWYLIGLFLAPRLTIAIGLSIYGKYLNLPVWFLVVVWILAIMGNSLSIKKS